MHLKNELEKLDLQPEQAVIMSFVLQSRMVIKQWYTFLKIDNLKQYYITHKMAGLTEELNVSRVQILKTAECWKVLTFAFQWAMRLKVLFKQFGILIISLCHTLGFLEWTWVVAQRMPHHILVNDFKFHFLIFRGPT